MMGSALPPHLLLMLLLLRPLPPFWTASVAASPLAADLADGSTDDEQQPTPKLGHPKDNPFGRPGRIPSELEIAAIFNKVAYGTTANPPTSHYQLEAHPTTSPSAAAAPTTSSTVTNTPPQTTLPPVVPPPLHLPSPPSPRLPPPLPPAPAPAPPLAPAPAPVPAPAPAPAPASGGGVRRPHVQPPEYSPPKRPPPMPAEYNPFANKPILRGSQSDGGGGGTGVRRPPPPAILPPRFGKVVYPNKDKPIQADDFSSEQP